jgi:hypothetical protein
LWLKKSRVEVKEIENSDLAGDVARLVMNYVTAL